MVNDNAAGTSKAQLLACTSATNCTTGTAVSGSEVTLTGTTNTLKRSADIKANISAGNTYIVQVSGVTNGGSIRNAKIIIVQSDATNGLTGLETIQMYANYWQATSAEYANTGYPNSFTSGNFTGTVTYYNEVTIKANDTGKSPSGTVKSRISDGTNNLGEVSGASSSVFTRKRSGSISPATAVFDSQNGCTSCSNRTSIINNEWLIIQAQSMPIPEAAIFALPAMLFLPKIVSWWKNRGKDKKDGGKNKPVRLYLANLATLDVNWNSQISKILGHRINGFKW